MDGQNSGVKKKWYFKKVPILPPLFSRMCTIFLLVQICHKKISPSIYFLLSRYTESTLPVGLIRVVHWIACARFFFLAMGGGGSKGRTRTPPAGTPDRAQGPNKFPEGGSYFFCEKPYRVQTKGFFLDLSGPLSSRGFFDRPQPHLTPSDFIHRIKYSCLSTGMGSPTHIFSSAVAEPRIEVPRTIPTRISGPSSPFLSPPHFFPSYLQALCTHHAASLRRPSASEGPPCLRPSNLQQYLYFFCLLSQFFRRWRHQIQHIFDIIFQIPNWCWDVHLVQVNSSGISI